MCGIVGFTGDHQAAPILLEALSKLEYRGYDSAGIAVRDGEEPVEVIKAKGRLKVLEEKQMTESRFVEPAESDIPDGQPTGNLRKTMLIPTSVMTGMW